MDHVFRSLLPLLLVAVGVVLVLGLWNMMRGNNPGRSQILMRWRIALQFIAIIVAMAVIYFAH
jgi:hypoxia induced protein